MKKFLAGLFRRFGLYERVRYSGLFYKLLRFTYPEYHTAIKSDLAFYEAVLGRQQMLIFDVGANWGDKAFALHNLTDRLVCIEPDQHCFHALEIRYGGNPKIALEQVAVGDAEGTATFFVEEAGSAYNTLSSKQREWIEENRKPQGIREVEVAVTTLDKLIEKHGQPDYIKIDVEGFEQQVIAGLGKFPAVLSFEANLPHFEAETAAILSDIYERNGQSVEFNLRYSDEFVFEENQSLEPTLEKVREGKKASYDVFVFRAPKGDEV